MFGAIKRFFKPTLAKGLIFLALIGLMLILTHMLTTVGLPSTYFVLSIITGAILISNLGLYVDWGPLVIWVIVILWIYLLSCIIMSLYVLVKRIVLLIHFNKQTILVLIGLCVVLILISVFATMSTAGVFVKKADDSGATAQGVQAVATANNQFGINLYHELRRGASDENMFFSPWSISSAFALAYEGASGETAREIGDVFYYPQDDMLRRYSYARTHNNLNVARGAYTLRNANSIWLQEGHPFMDEYKDTVENYYLGEIRELDFGRDPVGASNDINRWVSKQTNNKITDIVQPNMFSPMTRAVLANAIYFLGKWVYQFDKSLTRPEDFTTLSGTVVKTPMMRLRKSDIKFNYAEVDGMQILEMPYKGKQISMLVILPRMKYSEEELYFVNLSGIEPVTSTFAVLEEILSEEKLSEWRGMLRPTKAHIYLPKFRFETLYDLSGTMQDMGVEQAFNDREADFSAMAQTDEPLFINAVLHKAYIDVYEEGTEAAAATVISMLGTSLNNIVEFRADHPFIFIIQEQETGNILFFGRMVDPTAS